MTAVRMVSSGEPRTSAVRELMALRNDPALLADLLFLERWEASPAPGAGSVLRAAQIRRALPDVAAAIRAEIAVRR
jgi:hypothetical protein